MWSVNRSSGTGSDLKSDEATARGSSPPRSFRGGGGLMVRFSAVTREIAGSSPVRHPLGMWLEFWQTRHVEGVVPRGVRVRVPPSPPLAGALSNGIDGRLRPGGRRKPGAGSNPAAPTSPRASIGRGDGLSPSTYTFKSCRGHYGRVAQWQEATVSRTV